MVQPERLLLEAWRRRQRPRLLAVEGHQIYEHVLWGLSPHLRNEQPVTRVGTLWPLPDLWELPRGEARSCV